MTKVLWRGKTKDAGEKQLQFCPDGVLEKDGDSWVIVGTELITKVPKTIKKA